jgi:hypothetical protein
MARQKNLNEYVYNLAQDWIRWMDERRFFGPPAQKNILARLQGGSSSGKEPDAELLPEIAAFHLSVMSLDIGYFVPFVVVYCGYKPQPIKVIAHELGIDRSTFYRRGEEAANELQRNTQRLAETHRMMRRELDGYV